MEYKKLLLELLHRTEAISMTLQEILSENNLNTALEHLNKKKGIPGIDKMSMDAFSEYWHKNKNIIKQKLENGTYKPRPVMACYIAKPGKNEKRKRRVECGEAGVGTFRADGKRELLHALSRTDG